MSKDGGPAFPMTTANGEQYQSGITYLDYMAGQALAGLCIITPDVSPIPEGLAELSYKIARAMLAEREKDQ